MSLIEDPEAALFVRQRHPKDLNEAVARVLEIEAYLALKPHPQRKVSSIQQPSEDKDSLEIVSAIQSSQSTILQMLSALTTRVDKLEAASGSAGANFDHEASRNRAANFYSRDQQSTSKQRSRDDFREPVCRRCGRLR